MTPPRLPDDEHYSAARRARIATPLNLLIVLASVFVAVVWLITLQRIAFEREQTLASEMESNSSLAIAFEQQVFRTLKAAEQVAAFVREQYRQQGRAIDLRRWVEEGVIREEMFTIVSVVDEHGDIVSSSQNTGAVNYADREFFTAQRDAQADRLFISQPVLGRVSGRWLIPLSLRIERDDGRFAGVVVMAVSPEDVTHFFHQVDLGSQGLLELTGLDGVVRARKIGPRSEFGVGAAPLAWFQRQKLQDTDNFYDSGEALDGVARIVSYRTMADYPLMVTVATAYDEEMATTLQRRSTYLRAAVGVTLVVSIFVGLLMLMLVRQRAATDALQGSEALFRATFHQAAMGIAHVTPDGEILRVNEKFSRMLGCPAEVLQGRNIFELSDPDAASAAQDFLHEQLSSDSRALSPEIEKTYRRQDGSRLWVCEALGVVRNREGHPDFLVLVTQDITERKHLEARLSHDAQHDGLTGLPNRGYFRQRLDRALASERSPGRLSAVLYIDLDGFKAINDSLGHAAGDVLLQQVARRLEDCVRGEDTVARFGGDEFGIILTNLGSKQDCEAVARKVLAMLEQPFDLNGSPVRISASIGAAMFPLHGHDGHDLVQHADKAMYAAKHAGKNRFNWVAE
ncbi:sensor domain-containing diguanylate cyclase [Ectopseudomonas mendocina]|uniref:Diguanylate cyclase n=1 Tax=Ectopseudomonas mendocina TaxID=300 RepID=A0A2R3QIK9_ECTME|nr:sensor domain-containing diguanylate cyclase [Pseudomonas mendocina]AVO51570.1 diguanylate cyclase [Pseudomonas mendocina]